MITRLLVSFGLLLGMAACASEPTPAPSPAPQGAMARQGTPIQMQAGTPEWVYKKGATFSGERRVFHGVGSAAGIVNPALMRRAAEGQARADIARTFKIYVANLQKQYQASTMGGSANNVSEEQHVQDVLKTLTEQTLMGTTIVEYWENPSRNESYALARLDMQQFLDAMGSITAATSQYKELDNKMRDFIRENANKAHDELNQELNKAPQ